MGASLHVAKVYKVEYATIECFTGKCEEFHNLLDSINVKYSVDKYDDDFEVFKNDWTSGICRLKNLDNQENINAIETAINSLGYSKQVLISILEEFLESSDASNEWLKFSFW